MPQQSQAPQAPLAPQPVAQAANPQPSQTPRPAAQPGQAAEALQPGQVVTTQGARTVEEVQGLRARLEILRDQLQDAAARRRTVAGQLRGSDSKALPGLEARLAELDNRVLMLEREITTTNLRLSATPAELLSSAAEARFDDFDPAMIANEVVDRVFPLAAMLILFVLAPIGLAISRFFWKRATAPRRGQVAATDAGTQQRLDGLQQAVDTIAIEVERISEGQRFVTRLLNDRERAILPDAERR